MNTDKIIHVDTPHVVHLQADMQADRKRAREFANAGIATAESTAAMHQEIKNTARDASSALFWAKVAGVCGVVGVILTGISALPVIVGWFSKSAG